MTRRRQLLFAVLAVLALFGPGVWVLWPRTPSAINRQNFEKLRVGMTLAEVEAILCGRARSEATGLIINAAREDDDGAVDRDPTRVFENQTEDWETGEIVGWQRIWISDTAHITLQFDLDNRLIETFHLEMRLYRESPLAMLRRWLRV